MSNGADNNIAIIENNSHEEYMYYKLLQVIRQVGGNPTSTWLFHSQSERKLYYANHRRHLYANYKKEVSQKHWTNH